LAANPNLALYDLNRVLVIGTSCSGKTRFAQSLSRQLEVPHVELDALYWQPGWHPRTEAAFRGLADTATAEGPWIADGNYSVLRDIIWPRATSVVWLNYSFATIMQRALRRTVTRSITKEELFSGNRETFAQSFFSKDSILLWVVKSYSRNKRKYRALFADDSYPNLAKIEFTRPNAAAGALAGLAVRATD
jgi:adenylate kinase family enzyme